MQQLSESEQKPPYPYKILPVKGKYVIQIDGDYLVGKDANLFVARRINKEADYEITPEMIGDNLNGLSVNLLGGEFEPFHVKWTPTELNAYWNGCEIPIEKLNYRYDKEYCAIYINISEVNGKEFSHPRIYDKEEIFNADREAFKDKFAKFTKGKQNEVEMQFEISVVHRPTFANYWHCQIEVAKKTFPKSPPILEVKAKWEKKMLRTFRNFLLPFCNKTMKIEIPQVEKAKYYCNLPPL